MNKGYVRSETFAGRQLQDIAYFSGKIGISSTSGDYLFHGYKTSILRYLIADPTSTINLANADAKNTNLCVHIADEADKASDLIAKQLGGAMLAGAGEIVNLVNVMNNVLGGISVAGIVGDLMPGRSAGLSLPKSPGRFSSVKNKALDKRIFVRLSCYHETKPAWHDLGLQSVTFGDLAVVVNKFG